MCRYIPIEEEQYTPEVGRYRTYGICVLNEAGKTVEILSDISTDFETVSDLADRCTKGKLAPEHLRDVVLNTI
ncbi:MAG: hypothetical protein IJO75_07520 [Clostridia bacterium]|nr:hypothetical protein [Clostridia bacterium]